MGIFRKIFKPKMQTDGVLEFIAVSFDGKVPLPNFEAAEDFRAYYLCDGKVQRTQQMVLKGENTNERIRQLRDSVFDVIICRNFGPKAAHMLKEAGKKLYVFDGGTEAAFRAYRRGELKEI